MKPILMTPKIAKLLKLLNVWFIAEVYGGVYEYKIKYIDDRSGGVAVYNREKIPVLWSRLSIVYVQSPELERLLASPLYQLLD